MLPDVQHLMELQQADREILRLNQEVAALPKRVAAIEEKLAGTKAGLEKAKAAVKADEAGVATPCQRNPEAADWAFDDEAIPLDLIALRRPSPGAQNREEQGALD